MSILSIQSHVSFGHAGNSASVFPLQFLGHNVWPVHTVNYSNHTGYGKWKGETISAKVIREIIDGIFAITEPKSCKAVLSGYLGTPGVAESVENALKKLKKVNSKILFCCDPVMGDKGRGFFVKDEIPEYFKKKLVPIANIITPNHFEFNFLCGESATYKDAIINAAPLLKKGPSWIIIKSFIGKETTPGTLDVLAISATSAYKINTPHIIYPNDKPPVGTGDLFTSLYLGNYINNNFDAVNALEMACSSIYSILKFTYDKNMYELEIINAREQILSPNEMFRAVKL